MKRGEIWWAGLPDPTGSEPGFRRPVLIIQDDAFNASRIATVVIAVITTNLRLAAAPGNRRLSKRRSKLPKEGVVNVSQILTINKDRLQQRVSALPVAEMQEIDKGLRLVLRLQEH